MLNLKFPNPFLFSYALVCERISIKTHSIQNMFGIGPKNVPFAGVCVHFSARKLFAGCGSEGVKVEKEISFCGNGVPGGYAKL